MKYINFEWDENKAISNFRKHKISFKEAKSVFYDENARLIYDDEHSIDEERFIILGMSKSLNVLVVVHCYKQNDETIRIISARKSTTKETKQYKEFLG